jgi:superfamily II DNA or RNA helicase
MAEGPRESYLKLVRESAETRLWSRGVQLARSGAVVPIGEDDQGDPSFNIALAGRAVGVRVTLHCSEEDWNCECPSRDDPCVHVIAATIYWQKGDALPGAKRQLAGLVYRFSRHEKELSFDRFLERDGTETPLRISLAKERGRTQVAVNKQDMGVELALQGRTTARPLPIPVMKEVVTALRGAANIFLHQEPVKTEKPRAALELVVQDRDEGFALSTRAASGVDEIFDNGIMRVGGVLHALADIGLGKAEQRALESGVYYRPDQAGTLVASVLPSLGEHFDVCLETKRLPTSKSIQPHLVIEVSQLEQGLHVFPFCAYGEPQLARVVGERLQLSSNEAIVPLRDLDEEKRLAGKVYRDLGLSCGRRQPYVAEEALAMADSLRAYKAAKIRGDALERFRRAGKLVPTPLWKEGGRFEFRFEDGQHGVDAQAMLRAYRNGESLLALDDGSLAMLPNRWLDEHAERLESLLAAREDPQISDNRLRFDLVDFYASIETPAPPDLQGLRGLLDDFSTIQEAPLPKDFTATLRDYQRVGVNWLAFLRQGGVGGLLADDMGLGKTLQTLAVLRGRALVVAPTSVIHNWALELKRFRPDLNFQLYHGAKRKLDANADVILTSYALLRLDVETLANEQWKTVVLDESQAIKNPQSQVAQAAFRLKSEWRLALTGTPVENRLEDLWSQFHFLNPGLLGGLSQFKERYAQPIAAADANVAGALRRRIRPFLLRRLKSEVASELPPRTEIELHVQLTEEEKLIYQTVRMATRKEVVEKLSKGGNVMAALEALLRLRQAACHPGLLPGQEAATSSKIDLLLELLQQIVAEGHKALVFSQWTGFLDLVEPHLQTYDALRLDGSTRDRGSVVQRFQSADGPPILLMSLKAGGVGLNLTAADHVFLLDSWWNPAVEDQAADRAHRIGQDRPVLIHRLIAEGTVEEGIFALQAQKRQLASSALADAQGAASLTRDDLLALLQ